MAKQPSTTTDNIWQHLLATHREAKSKIDLRIGNAEKNRETMYACEDTLLGMNARGLQDILHKLLFLWPDCLESDQPLAKQQSRIIQDLAYLMGPLEIG